MLGEIDKSVRHNNPTLQKKAKRNRRAQLGEPDEALAKESLNKLDTCLTVYEKILSKQKYIAGDRVTLADLYHLPYGVEALDIGLKDLMVNYPRVTKWFDGLQARVSWAKVSSL